MSYTLTNLVSSSPINSNVGYNNSWIDVDNNADRLLCAQAMYITNLDEMVISLSTADVDIGHIKLQDADSELKANVVTVSPGVGGLVVSVANPVTSVNATITNPVTSVNATITNPVTAVNATITNPVTAVNATITNPVTAVITSTINVISNDEPGELFAFNNHTSPNHRGWYMDDTMRPVLSIQNGSVNTSDLVKIVEYEIGNNNANQSTIMYEWYEGPLTLAGAAIPAWTTTGNHIQYRVYQDQTSSNIGNTFSIPAGTFLRHCGIIIGKNTSGDEGPALLHGGSSRNMLTLCMKRLDNSTELDVWFAFTCKELA